MSGALENEIQARRKVFQPVGWARQELRLSSHIIASKGKEKKKFASQELPYQGSSFVRTKRRHDPPLAFCPPGVQTLIAPNPPVDEGPAVESSSEYNLPRESVTE